MFSGFISRCMYPLLCILFIPSITCFMNSLCSSSLNSSLSIDVPSYIFINMCISPLSAYTPSNVTNPFVVSSSIFLVSAINFISLTIISFRSSSSSSPSSSILIILSATFFPLLFLSSTFPHAPSPSFFPFSYSSSFFPLLMSFIFFIQFIFFPSSFTIIPSSFIMANVSFPFLSSIVCSLLFFLIFMFSSPSTFLFCFFWVVVVVVSIFKLSFGILIFCFILFLCILFLFFLFLIFYVSFFGSF
mmetsp:Transcript_12913/g.19455  ORF Transcript_12913/g.19455 Transcript_12913/m.19455 type:complete len:245 (+) Transcript_12913:529-1263(+)